MRKWDRKQEYTEQKDTCKDLTNKKLSIFSVHFRCIFLDIKKAYKIEYQFLVDSFSAEAGGFEPPVRLPVRQFSKLVVSATHPHFLSTFLLKCDAKLVLIFKSAKISAYFLQYFSGNTPRDDFFGCIINTWILYFVVICGRSIIWCISIFFF